MDAFTRRQLHALSLAFYEAHASAFDASRIDLPWPGWARVLAAHGEGPLRVLDVGCGNGRFAAWLAERGAPDGAGEARFDYVGTDANAALLRAAGERVGPRLRGAVEWRAHDFLEDDPAGAALPAGPFSLAVLMGVLHHVPGRATRLALLREAAARLAPGGVLACTVWRFADRPRFEKRRVDWAAVGDVLGRPIDPARLEPGDALLGFGDDPDAPPRYCHAIAEDEFATWPIAVGLETVEVFDADGASGDLNRYWVARRAAD